MLYLLVKEGFHDLPYNNRHGLGTTIKMHPVAGGQDGQCGNFNGDHEDIQSGRGHQDDGQTMTISWPYNGHMTMENK